MAKKPGSESSTDESPGSDKTYKPSATETTTETDSSFSVVPEIHSPSHISNVTASNAEIHSPSHVSDVTVSNSD